MAFWIVRAGKYGEAETVALKQGAAVVGWDDLPDLSVANDVDAMRAMVASTYPDDKPRTQANWAGQLFAFSHLISLGDLVGLPLKGQPFYAFGEVTGTYVYQAAGPAGAYHRVPVRWLDQNAPRSAFDRDLQYSIGSLLTVFQPGARDAEARVRRVLKGGASTLPVSETAVSSEPQAAPLGDVEDLARGQIADLIVARFKGHDLAKLVAEVLAADGFVTTLSPPGPDGGVDVLAGKGALGLEAPRIVVQVKSGTSSVDAATVRELDGVISRYRADHGLFVSWGGFKSSVESEVRRDHFRMRLWNSRDLIDAVLSRYTSLSEETRAQLPLRRVWAVTPETVEG